MPPIGPVIVVLVILAAAVAAFVAVIAHALIRRYWLACAAVTALALLGCAAWHAADAQVNDAASALLLYGIGGTAGLAISAVAGLPVLLVRRARDRQRAPQADLWRHRPHGLEAGSDEMNSG